MADMLLYDFVTIIGDDVHRDQGTFHLFQVVADPKRMNGMVLLTLRAVDVPVRQSGAWHWWHRFTGRKRVTGKIDLDAVREMSIPETFFWRIKDGKPAIFVVLAPQFDQLPNDMKRDKILETVLRLLYAARESVQAQEEILRNSGTQEREISDRTTQSMTNFNQMMFEQLQQYREQAEGQRGGRSEQPQDRNDDKRGAY